MPVGLILLVGPPAAGKSSFARAWVQRGEIDADGVVSCDAIRSELFGGRFSVADDPAVFGEMDARVERRLAAGLAVVVDATNVLPHARARMTAWARQHGRPTTALRFDVGEDILLRRNAARPAPARVPDEDLLRYATADTSRAVLHAAGIAVVDVPGEADGAGPSDAAARISIGR